MKTRTCVVAGVLDDDEKACLQRGKQLSDANLESRAFKVERKDMLGIFKILNCLRRQLRRGWIVRRCQRSFWLSTDLCTILVGV